MLLRPIAQTCDPCHEGDCPTVYTDDQGSLYFQGYTDTAPAALNLPAGEGVVRVPTDQARTLLRQLREELGDG